MTCYVNNVTNNDGGECVKTVCCAECRVELSIEEVALNQRLLGMQIGRFFCLDCLAKRMCTTPAHLQKMISRFIELGCAYFTRLMEATSHEKTDDSM